MNGILGMWELDPVRPQKPYSDKLDFSGRNIKGRPFWSRVLSVRLEPLQKGAPYIWIA
jgi:hypothetical protein